MRSLITSICLLGLFITSPAFSRLVVIVHPDNDIQSLSRQKISSLFLRKTSFLPNGMRVLPIDQNEEAPSRLVFYREVIGLSDSQLRVYWSKRIDDYATYPLSQEGDDRSVKDLVALNPHLIAYVQEDVVDATVKVVYP